MNEHEKLNKLERVLKLSFYGVSAALVICTFLHIFELSS